MKKLTMNLSSYRLWFMSFLAALVILVLWSQLSDHITIFSGVKYEYLVPKRIPAQGPNAPPILAYWILGSKGEKDRILRLLKSIYHPRNQYLLQLADSSSYDYERIELAHKTNSHKVFQEFGNVNVVGQSYPVNQMGASGLGAVLNAAALMLRINADWDWFIPLSTSDYPLWTQDEILYAFSSLPRDLNFVGFSNDTVWEKSHNVNQIVVDPSLWLTEKDHDMFYAVETREKPDAFQIFGGSPYMILSRSLLDHCVTGLDNLPRKLLMYLNNVVFPLQSYFQTILCNTPQFHNTTVNNNMRHNIVLETDKLIDHPTIITRIRNKAIFAGPFKEDDESAAMQEIDQKLLKREPNRVVPGKWSCVETTTASSNLSTSISEDFCSNFGDIDHVVGHGDEAGLKLQKILLGIVEEKKSIASLCRSN